MYSIFYLQSESDKKRDEKRSFDKVNNRIIDLYFPVCELVENVTGQQDRCLKFFYWTTWILNGPSSKNQLMKQL